ncbi:hypothetical protein HKCCE2091_06010 [Rhodobacterales bacterium HKCCE2091]|nr:hypothetical protein [Rhodobacterales bacterium HKCCE2091]
MNDRAPRDPADPKGLIRESYRIDGITEAECRSIFLDWALSVEATDTRPLIEALLVRHGAAGHPMTTVLRSGLEAAPPKGRRGGRAGRLGQD